MSSNSTGNISSGNSSDYSPGDSSAVRINTATEYRSVEILNDIVIDQIAAGEVVERPASVVKELVENALDAGASSIAVVLENGGQSMIEVQDDGCGMSRTDALIAIRRFGTSKLRSADDLTAIRTLGFRGEAIPSIASVSRFRLLTRPATAPVGTLLRIEGGELVETTELSSQPGTRVTVEQLFFNVPARRKFLKTAPTEVAAVRLMLSDIAAANSSVRIRLIADGKELLNLPPSSSFAERVRELRFAGDDPLVLAGGFESPNGRYSIAGLVSKPRDAVAGPNRLRMIVNGRSVRDRLVTRAIRDGYGDFLKGNRYPSGVVSIELPPEDLDVNVHPQKSEVRFRTPDMIFRLVHASFRQAFQSTGLASTIAIEADEAPAVRADYLPWKSEIPQRFLQQRTFDSGAQSATKDSAANSLDRPQLDVVWTAGVAAPITDSTSNPVTVSLSNRAELPLRSRLRFIGQLFQCYLFFEGSDETSDTGSKCLVIDMHAAHERVTFARLKQQYANGALVRQLLLVPDVIELLGHERQVFEEILPALQALGFDCEAFGETSVIVRSVPSLLARINPARLFRDLLAIDTHQLSPKRLDEAVERVIARIACHGSIRAGQVLGRDEAFALLEQLTSTELAPFCPHGRPVMIELSPANFEAFFGRD